LILVVLTASVCLGAAGLALAAPRPKGQNITASPTQITPEISPGASTSGIATIMNDGDQAYDFKAYVTPYHVSGESYDQSFGPGTGTLDASRWVTLPARTFHIEPSATLTVPYSITVPAGIGGGGYYAVMFFESLPKAVVSSGVASRQRVGIVVYLRVNGAITERGRIESFTVPFIQPGPPLTATLRLGNQGNIHYAADITAHVTDLFGRPKADIHLVREVLPGTTRRIVLSWDKAPSFGLFRVDGSVNMLGRVEVLSGKYVLVLSVAAFLAMAAAFLLLIILAVWWRLGRRSHN